MSNSRVFDGFATLDGGLNMGVEAELLPANQYATGINVSNRGGYLHARSGWSMRSLGFADTTTQLRFNGNLFQGAMAYTSGDSTQNSIIVSIGGRLFRIWLHQNYLVTEISPKVAVLVTADTTLPPATNSVVIPITVETPFTVGEGITILSGSFTITAVNPDQLVATYNGGASAGTIPGGTGVQDNIGNQIYALMLNLSAALLVWLWQAENYVLGTSLNQATTIFDGSSSTVASQANQQLPSGWVGVYAWGRNWIAGVDKRSYLASDLIGDPSGTPALAYKDAILYVTENNLLSGGGSFSIPSNFGDITAMTTLPQLDSSLGIGPVLIGCTNGVFSNQAPTDRTTWQNLTYPIQSVAYSGYGPTGPANQVVCNSDWWFRSTDGIRQFMAARRDFMSGQGTTPQSDEVMDILNDDDQSLLLYGSAIQYDNRLIFTVNPSRNAAMGIVHGGVVTVNLDTISTMQSKEPPAWESLNTGLSVFRMVSLNDAGTPRALGLCLNPDGSTIDLWELSPDGSQADDISIQTGGPSSDLIPAGVNYDAGSEYEFASLLVPGQEYVLTWGSNDVQLVYGVLGPDEIVVNRPGVGQVTLITWQAGYSAAILLSQGAPDTPVTAVLQLANANQMEYTHVQWRCDCRKCDFGDPTQLKKLLTGELYVDQVTDDVTISIYFKPDDYPYWTLWSTVPLCSNRKQCALVPDGSCTVLWSPDQTGYAARVMLPRPPEATNSLNNKFMDRFYRMQFKFVITGHCRIKAFKAHAVPDQQEAEGSAPPAVASCTVSPGCPDDWYTYNSYAGGQPGIAVTGVPAQIDFGGLMPRYYPGQGWQFPNATDGLWYTVTVAGSPAQVNISDTGFS